MSLQQTKREMNATRQATLDANLAKSFQEVIDDLRERLEIAEDKIEQLEIQANKPRNKWIGNTICEATAMEPRNNRRY